MEAREKLKNGLVGPEMPSPKGDAKQLAKVKSNNRGRQRSEETNPQLAVDIRLIVEPHTQSDPELKTQRAYTNLSSREVRQVLLDGKVRRMGMRLSSD